MCLLDRVVAWDADHAQCSATSHRLAMHPLRAHGRLGIAVGVEYAAQAMAVHGVLQGGQQQALGAGYLTSVRSVRTHVSRLDDQVPDLQVRVTRLSGDDVLILYQFQIAADDFCLIEGRASVVLDSTRL